MRYDLRLHGVTADGVKCRADISAYARSKEELFKEADLAARAGPWLAVEPPYDLIPEGQTITIEHVTDLSGRAKRKRR
ncbi:MAG: hypothetical protein K2X87_21410 [Gemmataceae bacterium]|nr:hypothetical protein [Gemmataceae bacterium]